MKKLSLDEMKKIEFDILVGFDIFCKENELKYSLAAGTMIGAVRHRGFVPWDDDIDIFMVRSEYERFIQLIRQGKCLKGNRYDVILPEDSKSFYPFIKIIDNRTLLYEKNVDMRYNIGVWIDIFPIDYICDDRNCAVNICRNMIKTAHKYMQYHMKFPNDGITNIMKNVYVSYIRLFHKKKKMELKETLLQFKKEKYAKYCGTVVWAKTEKDMYESSLFDKYIEIEFEGQFFMCFEKYDEILKCRYGNYMEMPPKSEQFSHDPSAFLKEE